jgi:hypothetical protein
MNHGEHGGHGEKEKGQADWNGDMTIRPCVRTDNAGMTMGHRYIADRFRFLLPFSVL